MSQFNVQDKYFQRAKQEGYRARSVYKLEGIQERYNILKAGDKVLDLGGAPGSFLQYISRIVGEKGIAVGVDLQKIEPFPEKNIVALQADIFDEDLNTKIVQELNTKFTQKLNTNFIQFNVITSDLAPKTSGVKFMDGGASLDLSLQVLELAKSQLKKGGHCIIKFLPGFNEGDLLAPANEIFKTVRKFRPDAIRKSSGEKYLVCLNKIS